MIPNIDKIANIGQYKKYKLLNTYNNPKESGDAFQFRKDDIVFGKTSIYKGFLDIINGIGGMYVVPNTYLPIGAKSPYPFRVGVIATTQKCD